MAEPAHEEGPSTAAYDFAETRFRINQVKEENRQAEQTRRRWLISLTVGVLALLAAAVAVNLARFADGSPLRFNLAGWVLGNAIIGAVLVVALVFGGRAMGAGRDAISKSRLQLAQLREAERDARTRMVAGGLTRLLWAYHSDVLTTIEDYRDNARKYRRTHNRYQSVIIVGSLMTTAITTAATSLPVLEWAAVVVSFAVGLSAGMTGYFKFRERSMNLQQAADELELEYKGAELGIRAYRKLDEEDRLVEFAERAEMIKNEQRKREQQLEQPPESNSASSNGSDTAA
jgi:hypothetical protein